MEENVMIEGEYPLEGRFSPGRRDEGWVICHPHPTFGGSMTNNVVLALAEAFHEDGFAYLRFNFRGVGASGGEYSGGKGEVRDVISAIEFLKRRVRKAGIAGYSFGAWVGFCAMQEVSPMGYIAVAPPLKIFHFPEIEVQIPCLFICGSDDRFSPLENVKKWVNSFPLAQVNVIKGADHLFWGCEDVLQRLVRKWLTKEYVEQKR